MRLTPPPHCILYIQHCIVYIERNACILGVEIELWGDPKNYIPALKISKYRYSILEFNIDELAFISETLIMRYGLKGKGRKRPDFFRVVLGPCAQFYKTVRV